MGELRLVTVFMAFSDIGSFEMNATSFQVRYTSLLIPTLLTL